MTGTPVAPRACATNPRQPRVLARASAAPGRSEAIGSGGDQRRRALRSALPGPARGPKASARRTGDDGHQRTADSGDCRARSGSASQHHAHVHDGEEQEREQSGPDTSRYGAYAPTAQPTASIAIPTPSHASTSSARSNDAAASRCRSPSRPGAWSVSISQSFSAKPETEASPASPVPMLRAAPGSQVVERVPVVGESSRARPGA